MSMEFTTQSIEDDIEQAEAKIGDTLIVGTAQAVATITVAKCLLRLALSLEEIEKSYKTHILDTQG